MVSEGREGYGAGEGRVGGTGGVYQAKGLGGGAGGRIATQPLRRLVPYSHFSTTHIYRANLPT